MTKPDITGVTPPGHSLDGVEDLRGQKPWREMSRAELDHAYSARATVPDIAPFVERYAALSAQARQMPGVVEAVPYGADAIERLDIFPAGEGAPVFIYIHGGYWRMLGRGDSSFMAMALRAHGVATVAVDYALAPEASMDRMVDQLCRAVLWVREHGAGFGIDPGRIHLGGSSAGAHLAAMVLARKPGLARGALVASGLYDLEPLRHGEANDWLRLDEAMARRNSPLHHIPGQGCPLILVHAASDTAEFRRQGCEFGAAWVTAGHPLTFWTMAEHNHFDNILELADTDSRLFKTFMRQVSGA